MIFGTLYAQIIEEKTEEYNYWLDNQKKMIDEIGNTIININNKDEIENEYVRLVKEGLNVDSLYIAFSDNTIFFSDPWDPPDSYIPIERPWYRLAMKSNGKAVETEIYYDFSSGEMFITVVKHIGTIDGLSVVVGADIFVPNHFIDINNVINDFEENNSIVYKQIIEEKLNEYYDWLNGQKKIIDEVGAAFVFLNNKETIENECIKLVEEGFNVEYLYVVFSDNSFVVNDSSILPDDWRPAEREFYKLAMDANGQTVETEIYQDFFSGDMVITIVKHIGTIDGLNAVIGADIIIPDHFFVETADTDILKLLQNLFN